MSSAIVTLDRAGVVLGGVEVLSDVSLVVREGEGLAVLGGNGSGKSTLLRLLRGDLWPRPAGPGRRTFHGPDGEAESPIGVRERMALVAPEAQDAFVRRDWDLPVEAVIRGGFFDALWPAEAATPAQAARVAEVAGELDVAQLLRRSMLELSRGEGRRVLLARALVTRPRALLLDEACDGLDAGARAHFLGLVSAALRAGTAVVMATHRREEILPEMGRVLELVRGRLVPAGPDPARRAPGQADEPGPQRAGGLGGPSLTRPPQQERPPGQADEPGPQRAGGLGGPSLTWHPQQERPVIFELSGATVLVEGRAVLADLDWTIRQGERWAIVGENGAGKSTLLRLLAGEEQPARGTADRFGLGPRAGADDLRGRVGLVSPELQARHRFEATGEEVVLSGFEGTVGLAFAPTDGQRARAAEAAARLGVTSLLGRHLLSLSYGELRKLLLARALAPGPEALLLDEPLAGLDPSARQWVLGVLAGLERPGPAVVAVSHHADELPGRSRVLRLAAGRLVRGA